MNKFFYLMLIWMLFLCSCEKKRQQSVSIWNGQDIILGQSAYPVSIILFKESATNLWVPYKSFDTADEIKRTINLLDKPEANEPMPELRTRNKLSLIYYLGEPAFLRVIEVYFDINDGVFIGPKGKSHELGKILTDKKESGLSRYRFHTPPYDEEFIDRATKSERFIQEEIKKLKTED